MWTFHPLVGFFSAVIDCQAPASAILVRFRDPEHAKAFASFVKALPGGTRRPAIKETPSKDYRWKLTIPSERYSAVMWALAQAVNYDNFKGRCSKEPLMASAMRALHDVWGIMHRHQAGIVRAMETPAVQGSFELDGGGPPPGPDLERAFDTADGGNPDAPFPDTHPDAPFPDTHPDAPFPDTHPDVTPRRRKAAKP